MVFLHTFRTYIVFATYLVSTYLLRLQYMDILATATFRINRLAGCPLISNKDLKKEGRGSFDYRTDMNSTLRVVKWHDNKAVTVASTLEGVGASLTNKRWDAKSKDHADVSYPDMIGNYDQSMGGVDLSDMLIALYRVDIQTRKRCYLKIITHCLNICNVNAWLLYRRYMQQLNVRKSNQIMVLQFTKKCASGLLLAGKQPNRTPGRPEKRSLSPTPNAGKKPTVAKPVLDVRYNGIHHWPEFREARNRCRVCSYLSFICCSKCHMCLCLQKGRNCFYDFHN